MSVSLLGDTEHIPAHLGRADPQRLGDGSVERGERKQAKDEEGEYAAGERRFTGSHPVPKRGRGHLCSDHTHGSVSTA